jgi:hypothetical protein
MNSPISEALSNGLIIEDKYPLTWRRLDEAPTSSELTRLFSHNCQILNVLLSLDEKDHAFEAEQDALTREIKLLDDKLNLVLNMLGQLLARESNLPTALPVCLGPKGLQYLLPAERTAPPESGHLYQLDVFLDSRFPQPVSLVCKMSLEGNSEAGNLLLAIFQDVGLGVEELLEKFIFRHHRRTIALSRQPIDPEGA